LAFGDGRRGRRGLHGDSIWWEVRFHMGSPDGAGKGGAKQAGTRLATSGRPGCVYHLEIGELRLSYGLLNG
jgi:hypothetical protein